MSFCFEASWFHAWKLFESFFIHTYIGYLRQELFNVRHDTTHASCPLLLFLLAALAYDQPPGCLHEQPPRPWLANWFQGSFLLLRCYIYHMLTGVTGNIFFFGARGNRTIRKCGVIMPGRVIFTLSSWYRCRVIQASAPPTMLQQLGYLGIVVTPRCNAPLCSPRTFCRPASCLVPTATVTPTAAGQGWWWGR